MTLIEYIKSGLFIAILIALPSLTKEGSSPMAAAIITAACPVLVVVVVLQAICHSAEKGWSNDKSKDNPE